jgi:Relaxase/Mobilisation nuclease domain
VATQQHVDNVLVHWGEDLVWSERKPVKKGKDETKRILNMIGGVIAGPKATPKASGLTPKEVRDHLVGVVRNSPQVVVKITGGGSDMKRIGSHIDYIARGGKYKKKGEEELELETEEGLVVRGKEARAMLKEQWQMAGAPIPSEAHEFIGSDGKVKKPRREALNVILSMPAGVDREKVKAAARATAKELFSNHQYVIAHHSDTDSQHAHVAVKMVGLDGQRMNPRKADLEQWRIAFAKQLNARGIEAVATRRRARLQRPKGESQAVRQMKDRGVTPDRVKTSEAQSKAVERAQENEKKVVNAYTHMAQALAVSPDQSDRALARDLQRTMQNHGVTIKLAPTIKPRL